MIMENSLLHTMNNSDIVVSNNKYKGSNVTKEIKGGGKNNKPIDDNISNNLDVNNLSTEEIFRLADLHFNKKNYIFRHLYDSYDKFLEEDVKMFLENGEHVFTEVITNTTYFKYRFKFENVMIDGPTMNNGIEPMFPSDARHNNYTYSVKLMADVTQYQDIIDIASDRKIIKQNGEIEKSKHIATIPLMVRSKWCSLYTNKNLDKNECDFDAGGYFIVNGNEKVVICQDRMVENKPLVFIKKDSGALSYIVQCNSRSYKPHGMTQVISVKMKKDEIMMIRIPILTEVNVCAIFRALGLESDRKIIDFITYDEHDTDMIDIIRASLDSCQTDKGVKISSQEEAIEYLVPKLRVLKKYTETDAETKKLQKQMHLKSLLLNNFLPHVEGPLINKAYYLGYMLNRLLKVYLKKQPLDDRDSYINKRIDLPGDLMFELFKQQYKKLLGECKKFFDNRNKSVETPVVVIANIKPNLIEQGFKASLSTGHWIRRQGVAQMLQRLTYLQTISFLRRVDAPGGDASSEKLTSPRHAHPSSVPFLCLTGDTEILMGDGRIELIKNLQNGDITNSVYQDTLIETNTQITNVFSNDPKKVLEITTISGRKIKCTPDHPILIKNKNRTYVMKNAVDLQIGDEIITRHFQKYIETDKKTTVIFKKKDILNNPYCESYYLEFLKANLIDNPISQKILEITARMMGFCFVDTIFFDNLNHKYCAIVIANNENIDNAKLIDDIKSVNLNCELELSETIIKIKGSLVYYLYLMGIVDEKIPNWIIEGNKPIKREFLCGLFEKNNSILNVTKIGYPSQTKKNMEYMNAIKNLFEEFEINGSISNTLLEFPMKSISNKLQMLNCESSYFQDRNEISYNLTHTDKNLQTFFDLISFRYNTKKLNENVSLIEYIKCKVFNTEYSKSVSYEEFIEKYYLGNLNLAIPIESICEIPNEKVYDYTTVLDTHTIMANGLLMSNCIVQTPEHSKVGLTKHLSLISTITIMSRDQYILLKEFISKRVKNVTDVPYYKFRDYNMFKVFLNGDWVGMTDKSQDLYNEMQQLKAEGFFDQKNVSIVADNDECEIRVYCDSGRLVRPLIVVKENELLLKKHHIKQISLNKMDKVSKITDWDEFLLKNVGVIEYVDSESQQFLLIATKGRFVEEQRKKMINSINLVKNIKTRHVNNRYDDMFYLKYTHCEIHPALLLGEITTNVPFNDRNQGPRNIFCYAQSRQAMGIFATNYRDRLDISFILYYPQRPLVTTRTSRYTNSEHLPSGENCIVAIACYTGYNQEDSLIFNKSSIERGKFRATYLKKYLLQIQKNQSTSQDDVFGKPEPSKLINMKYGSYDKLNDKGYAPEETRVETGDAVLGKMTPVEDPNNTGKCFKDSSETYKMFPPGVIDRAYIDIQNQDGYMTRKLSIRSERIPRIGDKYSCYDNETEILTDKGWKYFKDLQYSHKVASLVGDQVVYQKPTKIFEYDYNGKMYKIISNQIDLCVTPNHMMYVKPRGSKNYKLMKAEEIYGKRVYYKKNINDNFIVNCDNEGTHKQMDSWVQYNGKVYCCEVELSSFSHGILYVRRNKVCSWSGNSRHGKVFCLKALK